MINFRKLWNRWFRTNKQMITYRLQTGSLIEFSGFVDAYRGKKWSIPIDGTDECLSYFVGYDQGILKYEEVLNEPHPYRKGIN